MRASYDSIHEAGAARLARWAGNAWPRAIVVLGLVLSATSTASALDGSNGDGPPAKISPRTFSSAREALRAGVDELQAGDAKGSLQALTYAAEGGEPLARWKLGSMYASGDVVPRDDAMAYKYFEELVDSYDEDDQDNRDIGAVSNAFVAIGLYNLNGIANTEIKPDPERALEMFQVAATNFGDPEAQYRLARMYIDGVGGVAKDNMRAARWLSLAADKGHHGAQALLGHLLFTGDGVPRQSARGLMWLTLAKLGAKTQKDAWIYDLHNKDFASASDDDREVAKAYLSARGRRDGGAGRWLNSAPPAPMRLSGAVDPQAALPAAGAKSP
jgi:TPR repeat protein